MHWLSPDFNNHLIGFYLASDYIRINIVNLLILVNFQVAINASVLLRYLKGYNLDSCKTCADFGRGNEPSSWALVSSLSLLSGFGVCERARCFIV